LGDQKNVQEMNENGWYKVLVTEIVRQKGLEFFKVRSLGIDEKKNKLPSPQSRKLS
jgi:hypothetical protein